MPLRRLTVIGVLLAVLTGGFLWRYGDTTAAVDPDTPTGEGITTGWHRVDRVQLAPISQTLPGIADAADGIPATGTYLVNLWASWCGPCKHELPWLRRLDRAGVVDVLGVTRDNLLREAERAVDRYRLPYPNVRDELGDFTATIGAVVPAQALPSSFLVVDGRITWAHVGPFQSYDDLRRSVLAHL